MAQLAVQSVSAPPVPRGAVVFDAVTAATPAVRLRAWRDFMSDRLAEFDYFPNNDEPFYGAVVSMDIGPIRINRVDCSGGRWSRRVNHLVDGHDNYNLCMSIDSGYRLTQGAADIVRRPGEFVLIDKARPSECMVDTSGADYQIVVPRAAVDTSQRGRDVSAETAIDSASQPLRLLRAYVTSIFAAAQDLSDPIISRKVGDHLLDLAILGLSPSRDAAHEAGNRGLKAARLGAVLGEINRRFRDPAICPQSVAAAINISPRYLFQLLEERGLVFSKLVMELRLKRARDLLGDYRNDHLRIGQIAYDCGFNDLSYFNRAFRARFGDAPGAIRAGRA
ncbi:helix-turn-helix domain-containing protein [Mesorhizobium yinganensis]|uniref:helix-turn-helix domain-containing protein n=1 Tax=Mesorhizobium yinganensis TaxID=3157707 RepID=UPI0032B85BD8